MSREQFVFQALVLEKRRDRQTDRVECVRRLQSRWTSLVTFFISRYCGVALALPAEHQAVGGGGISRVGFRSWTRAAVGECATSHRHCEG